MSGDRVFINEGGAATAVDVQKIADVAASSEDRAFDLIFTPENKLVSGSPAYDKKVYPLLNEPPATQYRYGRALVYGRTPADAGCVIVLPAEYIIGSLGGFGGVNGDAAQSLLSASKRDHFQVPASEFPSSVTNGRTDTVYALVERVATTGSRKVKDVATGQVTTQVINLFSTATVEIHVAQGPADGTFAAPTLPADSGTAWYIPLANVKLDNGSGGAWTQGNDIAQSRITQTWEPGWIKRNRVQLARAASIMSTTFNASANGRASTPLSDRWGASISAGAILQAKSNSPGSFVQIDGNYDWSRRFAKVYLGKIVQSNGTSPALPDSVSPAPAAFASADNRGFFGFYFIPPKPGSGTLYITGPDGWDIYGDGSEALFLAIDSNGALLGEFAHTGSLAGSVSYYALMVEATDQFVF